MGQFNIRSIMLLLLGIGLAACIPDSQGPTTWIDRPLDGDQVALEPLTIQAHASDANGVTRFEFFVGEMPLAEVVQLNGQEVNRSGTQQVCPLCQ